MNKFQSNSCLSLTAGIILLGTVMPQTVTAQIVPDDTLAEESSQVNSVSAQEQLIEGGAIRESNLFHSFSEFNVGENQIVNFANPESITNIFSRVTGNNLSQILGDLGVSGNANLFLINPNGIIFGENASLNVNGSFVGTTANSINFADGNQFVANPASGIPLLTINQPTALEFGNQPGQIINRAQSPQKASANGQFNNLGSPAGLLVPPGKTLALIGGNILFEGGNLTATGGNIEVGSVGANSLVGLSLSESAITFDYQAVTAFADITLTNRDGFVVFFELDENFQPILDENGQPIITFPESSVASSLDASTAGTTGSLALWGRNIDLLNGSQLQTFTLADLPGGDINVNATEQLTVSGFNLFQGMFPIASGITSATNGTGNAGNIEITTAKLSVTDTTSISSEAALGFNPNTQELTFPEGNAGNIQIKATESVALTTQGKIISETSGTGDGGIITISSPLVNLDSDSLISTNTFSTGNAGTIEIATADSLTLDNNSEISSKVEANAAGNAGTIEIASDNLINLDNGSQITSSLAENATGNSGTIELQGLKIDLDNGGRIVTDTAGQGNAGIIKITADRDLSLDNDSAIVSEVSQTGVGNAGSIQILSSNNIKFDNESLVIASTKGQGNAGEINIIAANSLNLDNKSLLLAEVETGAVGEGGKITISAPVISFDNSSQALANTKGQGNGGAIDITANDSLTLNRQSQLLTKVNENGEGNAGDINITTNLLILDNNSVSISDSEGQGDSGDITLEIGEQLRLNNNSLIRSGIEITGVGNAGNILINSPKVTLDNRSGFSLGTRGEGTAGNLNLTTNSFFMNNASFISSSSSENATGSAGKIALNSRSVSIANESSINGFTTTEANAGAIDINANNLELKQGGTIFAATSGGGNAGNIQLNITENLLIDGATSAESNRQEPPGSPFLQEVFGKTGLFANTTSESTGDGGNITVGILRSEGDSLVLDPNRYSSQITVQNNGSISADSLGTGSGGSITLQSDNIDLDEGKISATTTSLQAESNTSLSNINLSVAENITLKNNSQISTEAGNNANGGNININAEFVITAPEDNSDIRANANLGRGGNITIDSLGVFGIEFSTELTDFSDLIVSSQLGIDGTFRLINSELQLETTESEANLQFVENIANFTPNYCYISRTNKYIVTGRGGLPLASRGTSISEHTWEDWRIIGGRNSSAISTSTTPNPEEIPATITTIQGKTIQGWKVNERGKIVLTDEPIVITPHGQEDLTPGC